ncbi:MAG: type I-E CRISPR-associated protein Cse2/CasB [Deltaproteobacteria bacterium]|nr:type I-E CRISPR-associated protein Cse2/CasB [Deltaproteobacteria bacterium]
MEQQRNPDFMALYRMWEKMSPGPKAEIRRIGRPSELLEMPAFYRLYSGRAGSEWEKQAYQRLIFCLPYINHTEEDISLGKALARGKNVSEKRLFQVIRSGSPNDMIQLRRILQMVEPYAKWNTAAQTLWYWNERSKRDLLEDYFMNQTKQ